MSDEPGRTALFRAFEAMLALDEHERSARLAALEASDPALAEAVLRLLRADRDAAVRLAPLDALLDRPDAVEHPAHSVLDPLGLVGRRVDRFVIVEPIGHGSMGAIYRAEDPRLGRTVALKLPLPGRRLDEHTRDRFLREARAAAALDHPDLCTVHEAGETAEGQLFLVMPLYEGENLRVRLERDGALPVAEALAIATRIASGLAAAHRAGVVHRDLKPANVLLLRDGGIKVLDFGIARVREPALTTAAGTLGTVAYMAPEQVRGEAVDARSDLWSLGVVLYEMLTGGLPFTADHDVAVAHAILHAPAPPPSRQAPGVPPAVDRLVLGLLDKQPDRRPRTADEVVARLRSLDAGDSEARAPRGGPPERKRWRAARWALPLLAAAVALVAGVWASGSRPPADEAPRTLIVSWFGTGSGVEPHLGPAVAEESVARLSRLRFLAVPPPRRADPGNGAPAPRDGVTSASGRIERAGGRLRLTLELTGPSGAVDRVEVVERTAADLVEAATAAVARGLGASRAQVGSLALGSPVDESAYDLYLRGLAAQMAGVVSEYSYRETVSGALESLREAESYLSRARHGNPEFAVGRARLAMALLALASHGQAEARRAQARIEAETALRLSPGLAEGHEALATYWVQAGDPLRAIAELDRALMSRPNAPHLHVRRGDLLRILGRWEESLAAFESAVRFDPTDPQLRYQPALTYARLRRYEDAILHWDRAIELGGGDDPFPHIIRGFNYLRLGNLDSLDAAIGRIPPGADRDGMTTFARYTAHRIRGRDAEALALLDSGPRPVSFDALMYVPVDLMRAQTLERLGRPAAARRFYQGARDLLEDSVAAYPRDARMRIALGLAYAGLGMRAEAEAQARAATELVPLEGSSPAATAVLGGVLDIETRLGNVDAALELIELLLALPAGREVSVALLRLDPVYRPVREDPRFEPLVRRFTAD